MDEFKPEDELKPDTSDRRPQRSRKTSSAPKVPVSRQHMMMGIGILVLLLLVIGIGSALNSPNPGDDKSVQQPASRQSGAATPAGPNSTGSDNNIDLSGSSSMSSQSGSQSAVEATSPNQPAEGSSPQAISAPPISSTPTQAEPIQAPADQQRVELPGDLNTALNNQQGQIDSAVQGAQDSNALPTAPATVSGGKASVSMAPRADAQSRQTPLHQKTPASTPKPAPAKPAAKESRSKSPAPASRSAGTAASASSSSVPGGSYTLQLSSASRSDTLNAFAKKQNLSGYHVYKTTRNGQPWYVLVSGSYATPAEAKHAVASLPADVRAKNPWVKPVSQVKKESTN